MKLRLSEFHLGISNLRSRYCLGLGLALGLVTDCHTIMAYRGTLAKQLMLLATPVFFLQ